MSELKKIIQHLQTPQKVWVPDQLKSPDLKPFPVEFEYLGRVLHRLGPDFSEYKIIDSNQNNLLNTTLYGITGIDQQINLHTVQSSENQFDGLTDLNNIQSVTKLLQINILIIGPEVDMFQTNIIKYGEAYVLIYHSYDNLYYPIISIVKNSNYLVFPKNNIILERYLE